MSSVLEVELPRCARREYFRLRETVCDLEDTIKIESTQPCKLKIKDAAATNSDASENGFLRHATNAAGFGEAITNEAEVSRHPAQMGSKWKA